MEITDNYKSWGDVEHGGDIAAAEAMFGRPDEGWIDLSTGINPWPYPSEGLTAECWARLPGKNDYQSLIIAAAQMYGADTHTIVPAPGTQSLIQLLPRLRRSSLVCVLAPTYGEHAHVWRCLGHDVKEVAGMDGLDPKADVVVVVNPNNPDGTRYNTALLLALAERLEKRGGWLVVDEAFADIDPEISISRHAGTHGLVVLRSFGKFFGLAGARLGFALTCPSLAKQLRQALGPWAVAGPTAAIGIKALADSRWIENTRARLTAAAERLDSVLDRLGYMIIGGTGLFKLVKTPLAAELHAHFARRGILVRSFSDNPDWLRFGLPANEAHWRRLEAALKKVESLY